MTGTGTVNTNDEALASPLVTAVDGGCTLPREVIGSKAWGVNRMAGLGLPVPPAFVVTTAACRAYFLRGHKIDDDLWAQIVSHLGRLEARMHRSFGVGRRPLLLSIRSGAAHSMPGMMDTILNLGINAQVERALAHESGDAQHAADTRRRFVDQYRAVVLGGREEPIPEEPWVQLRAAVAAVFDSWYSSRAQAYRRNRGLPEGDGTAVMLQAMVFGNADARSGTGVLFSRSPLSGDPPAWGEWLVRAQGEDVVSGQRTPLSLPALREQMPDVHQRLLDAAALLERDAGDIQDIEFTVEAGHLWLLQTRTAKRSPQAAIRAAVAFAEAGAISTEQAVRRLRAEQVRQLPSLQLLPAAQSRPPDAHGEPACPGIANGRVVLDPVEADKRARAGETVILARPNTSPEDLQGVISAAGVMTEQGGSTSHAAVVCRELGRPCVVGCGTGSVTSLAGERVTLDGSTGRVWRGDLAEDRSDERTSEEIRKLIDWGLPLVPVRLLRADDAPAGAIDLDALNDGWRSALRPGAIVRGQVMETDEGMHAALAAGVAAVAVRHRLPALLACLESQALKPASTRMSSQATLDGDGEFAELTLLRLVALKGRPGIELLADSLALPFESALAHCRALEDQGVCTLAGAVVRLTPAGQTRLKSLLAQERAQVEPAAALALYEDFRDLNTRLKQIMTAWQLKGDGVINDHADPTYDADVLERLARLHRDAVPVLHRAAALSARLGGYAVRLSRAAARIAAGERSYVARIMADSYHTVWFELHEDLIGLVGLTRAQLENGGA